VNAIAPPEPLRPAHLLLSTRPAPCGRWRTAHRQSHSPTRLGRFLGELSFERLSVGRTGINHSPWEREFVGAIVAQHENDLQLPFVVASHYGVCCMVWSPTSKQAAASQAGTTSGKQVARTLGIVIGNLAHRTINATAETAAPAENRERRLLHVCPLAARREIVRILEYDIVRPRRWIVCRFLFIPIALRGHDAFGVTSRSMTVGNHKAIGLGHFFEVGRKTTSTVERKLRQIMEIQLAGSVTDLFAHEQPMVKENDVDLASYSTLMATQLSFVSYGYIIIAALRLIFMHD